MNSLSPDTIKDWKLDSLGGDEQTAKVDDLGRLLYQAILVRSLDILSSDEQIALDKLLDDNATTPKEVISFLQSKIPTFATLVGEEIEKLKQETPEQTA